MPSLTVTYKKSATNASQVYAYALLVEVTSAVDMPDKIFVFQRGEQRTNDGDVVDRFVNIASPVDMENVPEDEPELDHGIPYYRKSSVMLYFRCLEDLYDTKSDIDDDISCLVRTYNLLLDTESFEKIEEKTYE